MPLRYIWAPRLQGLLVLGPAPLGGCCRAAGGECHYLAVRLFGARGDRDRWNSGGGIRPKGWRWWQNMLLYPVLPLSPGIPTRTASVLLMLSNECRAKETHWSCSDIPWVKGANGP